MVGGLTLVVPAAPRARASAFGHPSVYVNVFAFETCPGTPWARASACGDPRVYEWFSPLKLAPDPRARMPAREATKA